VTALAQPQRRAWWRDYLDDPEHGPLPALLLALTVSTGLVDAVSILSLGRVFVANMTGNVVFVGFALARAPGFSLAASLIALAGFLVGAGIGGSAARRLYDNRGVLLRNVVAAELVLVAFAAALATTFGTASNNATRDSIVALVAVGLGIQNAASRRLAVPDITTSVLTMTLTGIAADLRTGSRRTALRRALSIAAMLGGAYIGAVLVLKASAAAALWAAVTVIAVTLLGAFASTRRAAPWQQGHEGGRPAYAKPTQANRLAESLESREEPLRGIA
jgi:uncharacterized membrane protein YoaK (UPF0700 family)